LSLPLTLRFQSEATTLLNGGIKSSFSSSKRVRASHSTKPPAMAKTPRRSSGLML
jgi:hypothetical protein